MQPSAEVVILWSSKRLYHVMHTCPELHEHVFYWYQYVAKRDMNVVMTYATRDADVTTAAIKVL